MATAARAAFDASPIQLEFFIRPTLENGNSILTAPLVNAERAIVGRCRATNRIPTTWPVQTAPSPESFH
jgi:hypothetical protein